MWLYEDLRLKSSPREQRPLKMLAFVACASLNQAFFLYTPKKTETEKLSFFKKLRLKIEKKLKTEPKKLR